CAKHQRMLTAALKRARFMAMLPYTADHVRGLMSPQARAMAGGPPPPKPDRPPYRPGGDFRPAGRPFPAPAPSQAPALANAPAPNSPARKAATATHTNSPTASAIPFARESSQYAPAASSAAGSTKSAPLSKRPGSASAIVTSGLDGKIAASRSEITPTPKCSP